MDAKLKRPIGITLLALAFLWIGCGGSIFFPIFLISGLTGMMWDQMTAGAVASGPWLRFVVHFGKYPFLVVWFLFYVAYACVGFGLWKLRNWARLGVLGLSIFFGVTSLLITPFLLRPPAMMLATITGTVLPLAWLTWYLKRPRVCFAFGVNSPTQTGALSSQAPEGMSRVGKILTAGAVLGTLALFVGSLMTAVESMFRQSQIYKLTLSEAERSPCIATRLGKPLKPGWLVTGNMEESDTQGSAHLEIPIKGPKGAGNLVVSAGKQNGEWRIDTLVLVRKNEEMHLLPSTSLSRCQ